MQYILFFQRCLCVYIYSNLKGKLENMCPLEQVQGIHSLPPSHCPPQFSLTKGGKVLFWFKAAKPNIGKHSTESLEFRTGVLN